MPLYQYECVDGHKFEEFHRIDNRYDATCPVCGQPGQLQISKPNIRMATPVRWVTSDGKEVGWIPDGGITPSPGEPYPLGG